MNDTQLEDLVVRAVDMAIEEVAAGGLPFTALVVDGRSRVLGAGVNRERLNRDPTAHAEIEAIRNAAHGVGNAALHGAILIASGEPCAMCYITAATAGVRRAVFAVGRDDAARFGFDYRPGYGLLSSDTGNWPLAVRRLETANAVRPFELYRGTHG